MEANPESATPEFLEACVSGGVSRISVGAQSLDRRCREAIGRQGSVEAVKEALSLLAQLRGRGIRFSVDLMAGLPYQTRASLLADIDAVLAFGPSHVSLYELSLEEGTPLEASVRAGRLPYDADLAAELWLAGRDALEAAGYAQYEVSNFARSGCESPHNLRYWRMQSWLGAGPSASGTWIDEASGTARRSSIVPDVDRYIAEKGAKAYEDIDRPTLLREQLMMGFRLLEGPDAALFRRRFARDVEDVAPETFARWRARGLMREDKAALTRDGLLWLNRFLAELFEELDICHDSV
jgi:oxygen-independent coproporphyrinogen-3 oxidase